MTVLNVQLNDLNSQLIQALKLQFGKSAAVEIRLVQPIIEEKLFTETSFWHLISLLDWSQEEDAAIIAPAIQFLEAQSLAHIYRFSDMLSKKLWQLDTRKHAQVFLDDPENEGELSVDDFLYARCAVVANGQAFYEKILQNPAEMPMDLTFEPLLYLASNAYKRQTGKMFMAISAFHYETYSNKRGWKK
jgi:Protein of unknown function (DUF4240)